MAKTYKSNNGAVETTVSEKSKGGFILLTGWTVKGFSFNNSRIEVETLSKSGVKPVVDTSKDLIEQLNEKGIDRQDPRVSHLFDELSEVFKQIFP